MSLITTPKVHHFFPLADAQVVVGRSPLSGTPTTVPECQRRDVNAGMQSFTFPEGFEPSRVDDILFEDVSGDRRVMPNRIVTTKGVRNSTIFGRTAYEYDLATRTVTLKQPLSRNMRMHWFVPRRSTNFCKDWVQVDVKAMLVQGSNYVDHNLIPPDNTQLLGQFQGSFRCFPEIVSMPTHGIVRPSNNLLGFAYRGKMGFIGLDSFEYLVYNSLGQVSDTHCFTFQMD